MAEDLNLMTSKVFYDRLEDQTLQMTAKINSHQNELDVHFKRLRAQKERLNQILAKIENAVEQRDSPDGETNADTNQRNQPSENQLNINVERNIVSYASVRDEQIMKACQQILNAYNNGEVLITDDMVEKGLKVVNKGENTNDIEILRLDETQKELELKSDKVQMLSDLIIELDREYESNLDQLNSELEQNLLVTTDVDQRKILIDKFAEDRDALRAKYETDRERQLAAMKEKLKNKRRVEAETLMNGSKMELGENVLLGDSELSLQVESILIDQPVENDLSNVEQQFKRDYVELVNDFNLAAQQQLTPIQYEQFNDEISKQLEKANSEMDAEKDQVILDIKNRRRKKRREKGETDEQLDLIDENKEIADFLKLHHNLRVKKTKDLYKQEMARFEQDSVLDEFTQRTDLLVNKQRADRLKQQQKMKQEMMRRKRAKLNELKKIDEEAINQKYADIETKVREITFILKAHFVL